MKNVVVTGASGYVGSILINDLDLPEDLTIIGDNNQAIVRVGKSRVAAMDLRDTELDAEAAEVEEGAEEGAEEEGDQEDSSDDDEE